MVYLLRHPQSIANVKQVNAPLDGDITKRGEWQVGKTIQRSKNIDLTKILSSPALRCRKLADPIATAHNLETSIVHELRERDYGALGECTGKQIFELGYDKSPEGGESVDDVYKRAGAFLKTTSLEKNILIVSHGLFLKMLVSHLLEVDPKEAVKIFKFSNCAFTQIENGVIEYMNDRTHLGKPIKKIHILGGWGAGKTTLGANLSSQWNLPLYSLDELKYDGVLERPVETRVSMLDLITQGDNWITEGAWTSYAQSAFDRADILIYCDTSLEEALLRARKREITRESPPLASHADLLTEIRGYHAEDLEVSRNTHDRYFDDFRYKGVRITQMDFTKISFPEDFWDYVK